MKIRKKKTCRSWFCRGSLEGNYNGIREVKIRKLGLLDIMWFMRLQFSLDARLVCGVENLFGL